MKQLVLINKNKMTVVETIDNSRNKQTNEFI